METAAETTTEIMDYDTSWNIILHNFGFSNVAVTKFTDDYSNGRNLMVSNTTHINDEINQQKKFISTTLDQTSVVTSLRLRRIAS